MSTARPSLSLAGDPYTAQFSVRVIGVTSASPALEGSASSWSQRLDTGPAGCNSAGGSDARPRSRTRAAARPRSSRSCCGPDPTRRAVPHGQELPVSSLLPSASGQGSVQCSFVVGAPISELDHAPNGMENSLRYRSIRWTDKGRHMKLIKIPLT